MNYKLKDDYIPLNALLKVCDLVSSGGEANVVIMNNEVKLNDNPVKEKRKKIRHGDKITFKNIDIFITNE